ncbi:DNA polymerase III subunit delta' [Zhongshania aliphaticivorans]|uniref:DNA polymerase III subunit delta' n=1 Tax=Zhongshania aliphaticivorans TaxID=1470434 RepID=A0A5S9NYY4_9GAMM|nr:DNA polymerase III subunit delta' [Zhongshania aliphaticivorans]CAA0089351.1 DNA polymerase III subunit delta' [Zhongshania aliphaticivorans]CAA0096079.1 DNA polymerase III subunit delta' [Zhongshania aliphaticivorans]
MMMSEALVAYSWQMSQWQDMQRLIDSGRLPHALLLAGPESIGKLRFAKALAAYLLCESPSQFAACGQCRSCHFQLDGSNPDYREISPDEGKRQIGIDQVRSLQRFSAQRAHRDGGRKLVVIYPAEAMNIFTANALLKTLEEPTSNTVLILISHSSSQLLATIRSRCVQFRFGIPDAGLVESWLKDYVGDQNLVKTLLAESGGRPLAAKKIFEEDGLALLQSFDSALSALFTGQKTPLNLADELLDKDILQVLDWWCTRLMDLSRHQLAAQSMVAKSWLEFTSVPPRFVMDTLQRGLELRSSFGRGVALNKRLVLEALFIEWMALCRRSAAR